MKRKDVTVIVLVAFLSALLAYFLSNLLISDESKSQAAEVVPVITAEFQSPPNEYFNINSINPTQTIQIGEENASQPFGSSQ